MREGGTPSGHDAVTASRMRGKARYPRTSQLAVGDDENGPDDPQAQYVRNFLAFLGIEDVRFVFAEGFALGKGVKRKALAQAYDAIRSLDRTARQAA